LHGDIGTRSHRDHAAFALESPHDGVFLIGQCVRFHLSDTLDRGYSARVANSVGVIVRMAIRSDTNNFMRRVWLNVGLCPLLPPATVRFAESEKRR
jgi:hypothetical protein